METDISLWKNAVSDFPSLELSFHTLTFQQSILNFPLKLKSLFIIIDVAYSSQLWSFYNSSHNHSLSLKLDTYFFVLAIVKWNLQLMLIIYIFMNKSGWGLRSKILKKRRKTFGVWWNSSQYFVLSQKLFILSLPNTSCLCLWITTNLLSICQTRALLYLRSITTTYPSILFIDVYEYIWYWGDRITNGPCSIPFFKLPIRCISAPIMIRHLPFSWPLLYYPINTAPLS